MRISDWSSDVCSSDLTSWASCRHHRCQRQTSQVHLAIHERQRAPGCLKRLGEPLQMTILRWKAQSLQFHRHLTGPESVASRQGILPLFAKLAFVIASRSEEHTSELQSLMRISYAV